MFVKKAQQPPVFCSMPGVNNAPLLIITSIDTFPGNKSCYKAAQNCLKKDAPSLFPPFLIKKLEQKLLKGGSLSQLQHVGILCKNYREIVLPLISRVKLFDYRVGRGIW